MARVYSFYGRSPEAESVASLEIEKETPTIGE